MHERPPILSKWLSHFLRASDKPTLTAAKSGGGAPPQVGTPPTARWLWPAAALCLLGCPKQELAPLGPCTVSAVSERVDQTGVDQVDLLFVLDNSGSMASEQERLGEDLPNLVRILTEGDTRPDEPQEERLNNPRYFEPVKSLHIGVVTTNMGGAVDPFGDGVAINSCAGVGDDGKLINSIEVAQEGVIAAFNNEFPDYQKDDVVLAPDARCTKAPSDRYQTFVAGEKASADDVANDFRCISRVGVRGCPFEQQLEAMWKALAPAEAPSDAEDPELYEFIDGKGGQGSRYNKGFLRPDAILAVMHVSDEEDCSIKKEGRDLFDSNPNSPAADKYGDVNLRCGRFGEKDRLVWPAERYIKGLTSLKPDHPDRIIFGAIVGIPATLPEGVESIDDILALPAMEFRPNPQKPEVPNPSCIRVNPKDPTKVDTASPPRRFLEVAKGFGSNAVVRSICDDDYGPALGELIKRIAKQLKGNCLPRQLRPGVDGKVDCKVFELLPPDEKECDPKRGHKGEVVTRVLTENRKTVERLACEMEQVPVLKGEVPDQPGWYYDDFSPELDKCEPGEQQRIAFTFGALPSGAGATFECFQQVAKTDIRAEGVDAVNTRCSDGEQDDVCEERSDDDYDMVCIAETQTCQITCDVDPDCPPGWVCDTALGKGKTPKFCQQPTCQDDASGSSEAD